MKTQLIRNSILTIGMILGSGAAQAFAQSNTGTTSVSVVVPAEAAISITTGTTNLTEATGFFGSPFSGTTAFTYKVRTTKVGGAGTITVKITTDFPAGGPSVTTPLTGDAMTYTCSTAASATPCTGCSHFRH